MNLWELWSLANGSESGWYRKYRITREEFERMRRTRDTGIDPIHHLPDPERAREIGRRLRQAREAKGISLEHISRNTKIVKRFLMAIEDGDFERLPGGILNRSFVRQYARAIGFDMSAALSVFDAPALQSALTAVMPARKIPPALLPEVRTDLQSHFSPPRFWEFLLYMFLDKSERINTIGDLCQEYEEVLLKFGGKAAKLWFRKQVISSLWPLIRRIILRVRILAWLNDLMSKIGK